MKKVDLVSETVKGLKDGAKSLEDADDALLRLQGSSLAEERRKKAREEERKRKEAEEKRKGRKGKGEGDNYLLFCRACHWEYAVDDIKSCTMCNSALVTKDERKAELRAKVEAALKEKQERNDRRQRFERWQEARKRRLQQQQQAKAKAKSSTDYEAWDFWEPESDDESSVTPNTPEFKALEKDMEDRRKARELALKEANELKEKGNRKNEGCSLPAPCLQIALFSLRCCFLPLKQEDKFSKPKTRSVCCCFFGACCC